MKMLFTMLCLLALAGCATSVDYESWARAVESQNQYAMTAAGACETDLCRYVVTQEVAKNTIRAPRQEIHPGWELAFRAINTVATLGIPAYFGVENSKVWADMSTGIVSSIGNMDRSYTDNSVSIGRDQIGRDQDNTDSSIGRDNIGGNQHTGDEYADSCVGDACLNSSPADYSDNSDSSDNSDNSDNRLWQAVEPEPIPAP